MQQAVAKQLDSRQAIHVQARLIFGSLQAGRLGEMCPKCRALQAAVSLGRAGQGLGRGRYELAGRLGADLFRFRST